ncbi:DUF547 domain-containing protein [Spirulina sp. CS-785/01]|uniref:DUF547 domain-containing protein n=1 Tax=Spirulina sp. CS-785/01 TaxID=3021716 RepID=UPI00232E82F7|nr:DUF547 domain-containing protein [Spirulina sp. CS-785/01]MDB9314167.1 DUF547 domain-containing protein [Spirulina sp. CS-785/01]
MKTRLLVFPLLLLLTGCSSLPFTQASTNVSQEETQTHQPLNYDPYAKVLETYVDDQGFVDYQALQENRDPLDQFNQSLAQISPETYQSWSEDKQIAFWINAYNSFTLQAIIDEDPIKSSIKDIFGVWTIRRYPILDGTKTLDDIEHQTLRVDFNEPRIHGAINCASISCPVLRQEPYTGENLDRQLDDQIKRWVEGEHGLQIDREEGVVYLSTIFDWFGEDWLPEYIPDSGFNGTKKQKAALNFMSEYLGEAKADYLRDGDYKVRYLDYDWGLNSKQ